ncbi:hypothetical protein [Spiroplasma endosymbiont of Polydrusus pterygomalis]|uniref:hypothetical protein n=1 Tax=Spiroplasma endosymbiont of Polydrusus pterygomalis TaxID=3139327 RepID=UPI003CCB679A
MINNLVMKPSIIIVHSMFPIIIVGILLPIHIKQSNTKNAFLNGFIIKPISSMIGHPYFKKILRILLSYFMINSFLFYIFYSS